MSPRPSLNQCFRASRAPVFDLLPPPSALSSPRSPGFQVYYSLASLHHFITFICLDNIGVSCVWTSCKWKHPSHVLLPDAFSRSAVLMMSACTSWVSVLSPPPAVPASECRTGDPGHGERTVVSFPACRLMPSLRPVGVLGCAAWFVSAGVCSACSQRWWRVTRL